MKRLRLLCTTVMAGAVVLATSASAETRMDQLDPQSDPTPASEARAISDSGVIVGVASSGGIGRHRAVRWNPDGSVSPLTIPDDAFWTEAGGVNSDGVVAGTSVLMFTGSRPERWAADGTVTHLALPPEINQAWALAINDSGVIAGWGVGEFEQALLWSPDGTPTVLAPLPGYSGSRAMAISADGTIVGRSSGVWGDNRATRWNPDGTVVDLGALTGFGDTLATGINGQGVVVGHSNEPAGSDFSYHALRWNPDGSVTQLADMPGHDHSIANAINDAGEVVGMSYHFDVAATKTYYQPVRWTSAGVTTDLGVPANEWAMDTAMAVNNHGVIVGKVDLRAVRWSNP